MVEQVGLQAPQGHETAQTSRRERRGTSTGRTPRSRRSRPEALYGVVAVFQARLAAVEAEAVADDDRIEGGHLGHGPVSSFLKAPEPSLPRQTAGATS